MLNIDAIKRRLGMSGGEEQADEQVSGHDLPPSLSEVRESKQHARFSDLLNIEHYDRESGLYFNENSYGFMLECVPFTGANEQTSQTLRGLFKQSLPTDATIQVMLYASPQVLPMMRGWAAMRHPDPPSPERMTEWEQRGREPRSTNIFRRMARRRLDYLLDGRWDSLFEGKEYRVRNFRLFVTVSFPGANPTMIEKRRAKNARNGVEGTLATAGLPSRKMRPSDLVTLLHEILNPSMTEHVRHLRPVDSEVPIKEQVVDRDTTFRIGAQGMTINDVSVRAFTVNKYPAEMILPFMAELIGDEFLEAMQVPAPFLICENIRIPDREALRSKVQMKTARAVQSAESDLAKIMPDMGQKAEEWRYINDAVEKGVDLVEVSHSVIMFSDPANATANESRLKSLWDAKSWGLTTDSFTQVQGLLASLPFGYDKPMADDFKTLRRTRQMTEWNAINMMPLIAEWKGTGTPRLMLMGRRGQPLLFDLFDSVQAGNMNAAVVAKSGSGKSFLLNEIATSYVGTGGRVWIIDVGRSYERTCELLGGQFIEFSDDAGIKLNPFTTIRGSELDQDRMRLLKDIIGQAISSKRDLNDLEKAWVEQAIQWAWAEKRNKATMTDVQAGLRQVADKTRDARPLDLAQMLHPYTKHGTYGEYFEGDANLDFSNRLVVLELEELKGRDELQKVVLLIIMLQIQEAMYLDSTDPEKRQQPKVCIIDEAWELMEGGRAARFIETGYRRARKYGGSFMTATQGVNDYQATEAARAAWENSDWTFFLNQKDDSIKALEKSGVDVEGYFERALKSIKTQPGQFSEVYVQSAMGGAVGRFIPDPFTEFVYSTNAQEVAELNNLRRERGLSLADAVEVMVERRKERRRIEKEGEPDDEWDDEEISEDDEPEHMPEELTR